MNFFSANEESRQKITYTNSKLAIMELLVNKSTFIFFINREIDVNEYDVRFHNTLECIGLLTVSVPDEGYSRNAFDNYAFITAKCVLSLAT